MTHRWLSSAVLLACAAAQSPADGEVPLPAAADWRAFLVHDGDDGVWYAHVDQVIDAYGANEVIATDDAGRHLLLSVYSGKWKQHAVVPDGQWLAPSRSADVDPRVPGRELYAAGLGGNVHQIRLVAEPAGRFSTASREIGHAAAEEFHTVLAADLSPARDGCELLVFGITGAVYELVPEPTGAGFAMPRRAVLPGRVRCAVVLPGPVGQPATIVGASRSGDLLAMTLRGDELEHRVLLRETTGLGRITQHDGVLYVTRDDGVLLRLQRQGDAWRREVIFVGAQGLRGVAAGRFDRDPAVETVAVYGYGKQVQLVSRAGDGPWRVTTIHEGAQQGHWLCAGELDGRNGTDELVATGFDGRIVLLARPPGYGLEAGVAVPRLPAAPVLPDARPPAPDLVLPDAAPGSLPQRTEGTPAEAAAAPSDRARPPRIAVVAGDEAVAGLSPLCYQGGFETKSLVYETLVRRGPDGRLAPGLASSWRLEDGGRVVVFTLRQGAVFHDGSPVTAADVAVHFRRWVGLPEHAWLRSSEHITRVVATGPRELCVELDRRWALLPDLCAINPTAIQAPAALSREGAFVRPVGSGPFAFVAALQGGEVLRYRRWGPGATDELVDLVRFAKDRPADAPLDALLRGDVDAVLGSWLVDVDPARAAGLRDDPRVQVTTAPGSSTWHLLLRTDRGPLADLELRRHLAAAVDRQALVAAVAHGFGDPALGWAAPSVRCWPPGQPQAPRGLLQPPDRPLRLLPGRPDAAELAQVVAAQLRRAGIPVAVVTDNGGEDRDQSAWDLRLLRTHGVPYDPFTTLVGQFLPPANARNAESPRPTVGDDQLRALVAALCTEPDEGARERGYAAVQAHLDATVPLVPLYAPQRIAVVRRGLPTPSLDHDMYRLDAAWLFGASR